MRRNESRVRWLAFCSSWVALIVALVSGPALAQEPAAASQSATTEYRVLATKRTSTMEEELQEAGDQGYELVGLTVADTAFRGNELVTIVRRRRQ